MHWYDLAIVVLKVSEILLVALVLTYISNLRYGKVFCIFDENGFEFSQHLIFLLAILYEQFLQKAAELEFVARTAVFKQSQQIFTCTLLLLHYN